MTKYRQSPIDISLTHEGKVTLNLVKDLDKRFDALRRQILWALCTDLLEMVSARIPKGRKYDRLLKSLKVGEVAASQPMFSVYIDTKAKLLNKVDLNRTVLYIRPRKALQAPAKDIVYLSENGPWTVDTLPFWPGNEVAVVHQRKVDQKVVDKIRTMQEKKASKVLSDLSKLGRKVEKDPIKRKIPVNAKAVPDVVFQMLSLEFGGGREKATALWRQSLAELLPGKVKTLFDRYTKIKRTLTDAGYKGWHSWPVVRNRISLAQVKAGSAFQKRLGV